MGNMVVRDGKVTRPINNEQGHNVTDLSDRLDLANYLTPHSDIVALMVLEHQTLVHNRITKASFATRQALHYEQEFNRAVGEGAGHKLESTTRRIQGACDKLVESLLFVDEAPLASPISGSAAYGDWFSKIGPRDSQGRSLRDLDLNTRMFKYPCSYLIHSTAFDQLPPQAKEYVAERLLSILSGKDTTAAFAHLSAEDRRAILEILAETKPDLWKQPNEAEVK
jgi:hypothetical protein